MPWMILFFQGAFRKAISINTAKFEAKVYISSPQFMIPKPAKRIRRTTRRIQRCRIIELCVRWNIA